MRYLRRLFCRHEWVRVQGLRGRRTENYGCDKCGKTRTEPWRSTRPHLPAAKTIADDALRADDTLPWTYPNTR